MCSRAARVGLIGTALCLLAAGCSSSSSDLGALGKDDAQFLASNFTKAAIGGLAVVGAPPAGAPRRAASVQPPVNIQISSRINCTSGGTIQVSGNVTGTVDQSGNGFLSLQVLESITDWSCDVGHLVEGDPYLSLTGSFNFANGALSSAATLSLGGGFRDTVTGARCAVDLSFIFNPNGSAHASGTICGYAVDVTE